MPGPNSPHSPPPTLSFNAISSNMTAVCTPINISWAYTGPPANISLSAARLKLSYSDKHIIPNVQTSMNLSTVNASSFSFLWTPTRALPGSYFIQGSTPTLNSSSNVFHVDASCLAKHSAPANISSPSIHHPSNTSAIVGYSLGGVAVVMIAIVAILYLLRFRRRSSSPFGLDSSRSRDASPSESSATEQPSALPLYTSREEYLSRHASIAKLSPFWISMAPSYTSQKEPLAHSASISGSKPSDVSPPTYSSP
ncbi:hypothetical protein SERLA73DRAFT_75036 [Serpula lacrymans var. lacrymans S7.3]|uniref:Uncharacterized protein n=2 Tax=Serpula lacrymans var. lacrymans TaxID=341189 RepID=F8Q2C2_SERL3|nr:uncharacterized protein SERLADRAFT_439696 [Serpula lacrymans var. lacrymans S7.9]EGN97333.1 hypothetical protein SERLA73DRAFT_75036 [Serpula lacrymans var. lacrymans S7.3]EGO22922.1 hypothetical protein SERLADRAFT_439696 [Serpula lacrymans var. lacrymans S7.9]